MTSKLGKFGRTFVCCEFVVTTTKFLQKLVVNRTTAANFFPPNFVALLCHVTGMRTKVQMIDFVVVVVVVVGSKGLYYFTCHQHLLPSATFPLDPGKQAFFNRSVEH